MPSAHVHPTTTGQSSYIRCPLCRLKFHTGTLGQIKLQKHQGRSECLKRKADKEKKHKNPETINAAQVSISAAPSITRGENPHPAVVDDSGVWTQKCDRCDSMIKHGRSHNRGAFDSHRNSGVCERKTALKVRAERLEKQKNLMGSFLKRTPSKTILKSGEASGSMNKARVDVSPSPAKRKGHNNAGEDRELKPSDANLGTLARDVRRALAEIPTGEKRKNGEGSGSPKKKPKMLV